MVINHLLNGMILQVGGFIPFQVANIQLWGRPPPRPGHPKLPADAGS